MKFSRNTTNFFKSKQMKNLMNNKFSYSFLNYNMYKISFISFSNAFFLNNLQRSILANKSLSSSQISKLVIGDQSVGDCLETSSQINDNLSEGVIPSEFLISNSKI